MPGNKPGYHLSDETRRRMSESAKKRSPEHLAKIVAAIKGKPKSAQHIANMIQSCLESGAYKPLGATYIHHGYRYIKVRMDAGHDNFIAEHRYVMEQSLGRPLTSSEKVHHINGDPLDNRLENLKLVTQSAHMQIHNSSPETKQRISEHTKRIRAVKYWRPPWTAEQRKAKSEAMKAYRATHFWNSSKKS